jgi:hypothetical protein
VGPHALHDPPNSLWAGLPSLGEALDFRPFLGVQAMGSSTEADKQIGVEESGTQGVHYWALPHVTQMVVSLWYLHRLALPRPGSSEVPGDAHWLTTIFETPRK